jgi:transposase
MGAGNRSLSSVRYPGRRFSAREAHVGAAVKITRTDHTAAALRGLAAKSSDAAQVRRLLALSLILQGRSRREAAEQAGMDRQTLRDWVHRYNAEGVPGLKSIRIGGHPASLNKEQMAELQAVAIEGPDPAKDKVVRWRCVDLREEVARRFTVTVSERTIGRWLRRLEMTRLQPRPFHPKRMRRRRKT